MRADLDSREAFSTDEFEAWQAKNTGDLPPAIQVDHCDECRKEVPKGTLHRRSDKHDQHTEYLCDASYSGAARGLH